RGFVVALHGIQSHGGWYEYSCQRMCDAGYDVLFVDRRGSGENAARRGDAPHGDRLINDVVHVLVEVRRRRDRVDPQIPVVLLAVSWGGKLAAITAARRPELVEALALLYPGLCSRVRPTSLQRARLWLARKLDIRHKRIEIPLNDPALFTAEPRWQEFIRHDPLVLRDVTSGFLLAHQDLTRESLAAAPLIRCPTLLMLAGRDRIIDNAATKDWSRRLGTREFTLHEYPDVQHTLEFEPHPEQFVTDLLEWLATNSCQKMASGVPGTSPITSPPR
ncbi:MAG: alpha/beta fold hydrolase, partial [Planctomycetaceae bacterium]|nr:alpha/beta fold hydrolase [Planctomycetaceae bacterium]